MPGSWRTDAWRCATIASASLSSPCFRPPVYSWLQAASPANSENRFLRPAQRIRPAVGRKVLALLPAALKRRCRATVLDIDAVLDAEYVLITERCRTEGLICAVRKLTQYDLPR